VITHRDLYEPDEARQIRDQVRAQLRHSGIAFDRIYFTKTVSGCNDEFFALARAINEFGVKSKGPLLTGWTEEVTRVVEGVSWRERTLIERLGQAEDQRLVSLAALRRELAAVQSLATQLASDGGWGIPCARSRARPAGLTGARDLAREIAGLVTRDAFGTFADRADQYLAELNAEARTNATSAWNAAAARTRSLLAGGAAGRRAIRLPEIFIPGEVFPSAEFLRVVRSCQWRSFGQRVKGLFGNTPWKQDVDDNQARIDRAWAACSRAAAAAIDAAFTSASQGALAEMRRLAEGISAEIAPLSVPPSDEAKRAAQAGLARSVTWLRRVRPLSRLIKVHVRGSR
jgi:hypothetical protein